MYATVIVARRLPRALWLLTYEIPATLFAAAQVGSLVRVPFGKSPLIGVVLNLTSTAPQTKNIKPITEVLASNAFSPQYVACIEEIASRYATSPGFLFKNALPSLTKKFFKQIAETKIKPNKQQLQLPKSTPLTAHYFGSLTDEQDLWKKFAPKLSGQTLILVPEIEHCEYVTALLPAAQRKKTLILTSNSGAKEFAAVWHAARENSDCIVIGTRAALLLPWRELASVIVYDDANPSHKSWDMAPRFFGLEVAQLLAERYSAQLVVITHTPSLGTAAAAPGNIKDLPLTLVNMKEERRSGNTSVLSSEVWQNLLTDQTGATFLFLNRRGDAQFLSCRECGNVSRCPNCTSSLSVFNNRGILECRQCGYNEAMTLRCKKCQATSWILRGAGIEQLEREVKSRLPKTRRIVRVDGTQQVPKKLEIRPGDVLIGTQYAWNKINWKELSDMVFVDPDASLFMPEPAATLELWHNLRDAHVRLNKAPTVQTSHPEHLVYRAQTAPEQFYQAELATAHVFAAPPFSLLFKAFAGFNSKAQADAAAAALALQLRALTKEAQEITIAGSFAAVPQFIKGQFWSVVLAKLPATPAGWEAIKKLVTHTPETWKIDVNPRSRLGAS